MKNTSLKQILFFLVICFFFFGDLFSLKKKLVYFFNYLKEMFTKNRKNGI